MTGLFAAFGLGFFTKWLHSALKIRPNQHVPAPVVVALGTVEAGIDDAAGQAANKAAGGS